MFSAMHPEIFWLKNFRQRLSAYAEVTAAWSLHTSSSEDRTSPPARYHVLFSEIRSLFSLLFLQIISKLHPRSYTRSPSCLSYPFRPFRIFYPYSLYACNLSENLLPHYGAVAYDLLNSDHVSLPAFRISHELLYYPGMVGGHGADSDEDSAPSAGGMHGPSSEFSIKLMS